MPQRDGMSGRWKLWEGETHLRSRLHRTFGVILVSFAILGVLGLSSRINSLRAVDELIHGTQPLAESNARLLQTLIDADSSQRGYRLLRDRSSIERFSDAITELPRISRDLQRLAAGYPELKDPVLRELTAAEMWANAFALPLVTRLQRDGTYQPPPVELERGRRYLDQARDANERTRESINRTAEVIHSEVHASTIRAGIASGALLVVLLAASAIIARRTTASVADPLEQLRATIERLSAGDLAARARVEGPTEARAVADAVNDLAGSAEQAKAMQNDALARMMELDQARADFVSSVSHELRTPLTSVTGYAEMLLDGDAGDLTKEQVKMVTTIDRNARRLLALVEDILTVARLEAGAQKLAFEPVEVAELVNGAAEAVRPQVRAKSLALDIDTPPAAGTIRGDRAQLERVVLNLLSNAVKFTPARGKITLSVVRQADRLTLTVSDTGFGIPLAEQSRMFERFFRSSTSRDQVIPGTGLGLTIVKSIVDAHGGTIDFHSTPGRGTTFVVELPVAAAATGQTVPV